MRRLGIAVLGLFCGLFIGFLIETVVATIVLGAAGSAALTNLPLALFLGFVIPACAVAGVIVALLVDGRTDRRRLGAAIIGAVCGLLAGWLASDGIAAVVFRTTGELVTSTLWAIPVRAVIPLLGAVGVLAALANDNRRNRREIHHQEGN